MPVRDFPLFPLKLVALPTEAVPLHIFEQRYQTMFAVCLEQESEFGIVLSDDDGLRDVGCACTIEQVLETMPGGEMNVLNRGQRPFRLLERQDDLPYPAGVVDFLEDEPADDDEGAAAERARAAYAKLVDEATEHEPDAEAIARMSAYAIAATVDFGLDAKQGLLELRSEAARFKLLERLLLAALKRLDFSGRAEARAKSNGTVKFG